MKLRYVGDGNRYLNGVPAADHEQDDPETIAIALESRLYVEDDTPEPKKIKKSAPPADTAADAADSAQ